MPGSRRAVERLAWEKFAEYSLPFLAGTFPNAAAGSVFYVDSASGNSTFSGRSINNPCATIAQALAHARAVTNRHAYILVAPWHTETIDADGDLDIDENDVTVIGCGTGDNRPLLTISSATDANITISGTGCRFDNMRISIAIDAATAPIVISGDGCTMSNVHIIEASDCEAIDLLSVGAAARVTLENITIEGRNTGNGDAHCALHLDGCEQLTVRNFVARGGDWEEGVVKNEDNECLDLLFDGGFLMTEADENILFAFHSNATGMIRNVVGRLAGTGAPTEFGNAFTLGNVNLDSTTVSVATADGGATFPYASLAPGTRFAVTSSVTSSGIPNNTQTGGAITGAATGALLLEEITVSTDSTGLAGPTNIEFSTDNDNGVTGAGAPLAVEVIASFGANKTMVATKDATSHTLPMVIEQGKKLYIHGDDGAGTGSGVAEVTMVFQRIDAGATIAAADISGS